MRILITNNTLVDRAGSELVVRDLALELAQRGHDPVAYSTRIGGVARELADRGIPVVDDLRDLSVAPDVIHGQHHMDTMTAVMRFPRTPALYVCHGWIPWEERPPVFPSIRRYVAVDDLCRERLLTTPGVDPERVSVILNSVDLARFPARAEPLPHQPRRVLVFSNRVSEENFGAVIRRACRSVGIDHVDLMGADSGRPAASPENLLAGYDIVFAKGRAALEAMASGAAVVTADSKGLGRMVTTRNFDRMRRLNFGLRTMQDPQIHEHSVRTQLGRYDPHDAAEVAGRIRHEAGLTEAMDRWEEQYQGLVADPWDGGATSDALAAAADYVAWLVRETADVRRGLGLAVSDADESRVRVAQVQGELARAQSDVTNARTDLAGAQQELAAARARSDESALALNAMAGSRAIRAAQSVRRLAARLRNQPGPLGGTRGD